MKLFSTTEALSKVVVKTIGRWYDYMFWNFNPMLLIRLTTLLLRLFVLWFLTILLCFSYNDSYNHHNYYASMMNNVESEYPFGDFLEYFLMTLVSIFNRIARIKMELMIYPRETSPCMISYLFVGGRPRVFIPSLVIYFTYLSNVMRCGKNTTYWLFKVSNIIYEGVTPTFDNIKTEHENMELFIDYMFVKKQGSCGTWSWSGFFLLLL